MAAEFSPSDALLPAVTLLATGAAAALGARALRISPIVGYLAAGVIIGPYALNFMSESSTTHLLAELGVVFLLFDIGMHISMRELKESRQDLLGLGPAHLIICAFAFSAITGLIGVSWPVAIAIGISVALSSTAVVARVLAERNLNSCPLGRSLTHVLIFQDIVAIFLLIFASSLGGDPASVPLTMAIAAGQALLAFAAAIVAGRYLMSPVLRALAATRNQEAFTAFTLLMVLGAACATYLVGLSLTLGAFLAGLAVSGTQFRHQIQTETGPFRGLLLSFFFINVGLMVNVPELIANLPLILGVTLAMMVIKTAGGFVAGKLNGWSNPGSTQMTFLLSQGSEFTLVVLSILAASSQAAVAAGAPPLMDPVVETVTVASVALTLVIAPFWADAGMRLARELAKRAKSSGSADVTTLPSHRPVIVFGMTETGRLAVDALEDHDIPYVALDNDPDRFVAATADGYTVSYGDAANLRLVDAIGANKARAVVIGAPRYEVSRSITPAVTREFPGMDRFVALDSPHDVERFSDLGMRAYLAISQPKGIEMATDLLRALGVDDADVADWLRRESERFNTDDLSNSLAPPVSEAA